jgi:hypothetical protein
VIRLVPAEEAHIPPIAKGMREIDREEAAAFGKSPTQALLLGLKGSVDCYTAMLDGEPVAMLGLVPKNVLEGEGCPWMLGTEAIYNNPRGTLVLSRKMIERWGDSSRTLANLIAKKNARAIRYLRRLGFEIGDDPQMIGGLEFVSFKLERR